MTVWMSGITKSPSYELLDLNPCIRHGWKGKEKKMCNVQARAHSKVREGPGSLHGGNEGPVTLC